MKVSAAIAASCAAMASAAATPVSREVVGGITYTGPITPGGPDHVIHGTVEQIYAQILKLNPSFKEDQAKQQASLDKRVPQVTPGLQLNCNPDGLPVPLGDVQPAIDILRLFREANCHAPRGWGGCEVISCKNSAGVFLCNDDASRELNLPCGRLGDLAQDASQFCKAQLPKGTGPWYTKGQLFGEGNSWNVIIKKVDGVCKAPNS